MPESQAAGGHSAGAPPASDGSHPALSPVPGPHPVRRRHPPTAAGDDHRLQRGPRRSHGAPEAGAEYVRPVRQDAPGKNRPQYGDQDHPHRPGLQPGPLPELHGALPPLPPHSESDSDHQILRPAGDPGGRPDAPRLPDPGAGSDPPAGGGGHPHRAGGAALRPREGSDGRPGTAGGQRVLPAPPAGVVCGVHPVPLRWGQHHPPACLPGARPAARHQPHPALRFTLLPGRVQ